MRTFAIYFNPSDHPGKHVVRGFTSSKSGVTPDLKPFGITESLSEARKLLPTSGLSNLGRSPDDDSCIIEVWC